MPPQPLEQVTVFEPYEVELPDNGEQLHWLIGVQATAQLACIVISRVTSEHTPVDELNVPPQDPGVIVKPLNVYPDLLHVTGPEAAPPDIFCDAGEQVPPFPADDTVHVQEAAPIKQHPFHPPLPVQPLYESLTH